MNRRREFLIGMAFSGFMIGQAKSACKSGQEEQKNAGRPSLGFSLYGMKSLSLQDAVRACSEIGYTNIELSLLEGYPTALSTFSADAGRDLMAQLQQLELTLPCMMVQLNLTADSKSHATNLETIRKAGSLAREISPGKPPMLETILGGSPDKWEDQKSGMAEQLKEWMSVAEAAKVDIAIKAHVRSAVNTPERLLWLLESANSPRLCVAYDYSHFELQGIGLRESLNLLLDKTRFIHVKDSVGTASKFEFMLPGKGMTDYVDYFSILRAKGYRGPVCVEVSGQVFNKPDYQPIPAARACFATLQSAMDKVFSS